MRRIFYLMRREIAFLGGTVALIGIILTIFCAAFLAVVAVYFDVPNGLYQHLADDIPQTEIAIPALSAKEAYAYGGDWVYTTKAGLTCDVVIKGPAGSYSIGVFEGGHDPFVYNNHNTTRAFGLMPDQFVQVGRHWEPILTEGRIPSAPDEFICTTLFAKRLGAKAGESVSFGERQVVLAGIIDSNQVWDTEHAPGMPPLCAFYVCVDPEEKMDFCYLHYESIRAECERFETLARTDLGASLSPQLLEGLKNVDLCEAFFGAIALVLGVMVLFILYSLIAIFYRQRRTQICRFRLLGASSRSIAGVYCTIVMLLAIVATGLGTAFSILFNHFFMGLCSELFEWTFAAHFCSSVPFALLLGICIFDLVLYGIFSLKIKNARIAEEIKHE